MSSPSPLPLVSSGLSRDLHDLKERGGSVKVCIVGSGEMGTDLVTAISQIDGMEICALVDRKLNSAPEALGIAGLDSGVVCETDSEIGDAFGSGGIPIVPDARIAITHDLVDVVIDATGRPVAGAELGLLSIESGKHLVMMNVEADVTVGFWLRRLAQEKGVVYTIGAGDEPTSIMELYNFVTSLGYPVIAAGKGKNNAFVPDAVPADYIEEATHRKMNPRMLVEFVDGSKTAVEMGCVSNATGLVPDCPGMHGPDCSLDDLHNVFCPVEDGGILSSRFCVDYTVGSDVAPGVFVIAEMRHSRVRERMSDLNLGDGPYYTFFRPWHLTSLEVPLSAARAVLYGRSDMCPLDSPVSEVCALSKRDLRAGEVLDSIGETCYRSWLLRSDEAHSLGAVPVGLLDGGRVTKDTKKGELLTYSSVAVLDDTALYRMRCLQDEFFGRKEVLGNE